MRTSRKDADVSITPESPEAADAVRLIEELERYIVPMYPHDSEHGLSPAQMAREGVAFFIARCGGKLAGCGGLRFDRAGYAEVMRMYVRPQFSGKGLGRRILRHLETYALWQGVGVLRLKIGISQPEALGLYERSGYRQVPAFGSYRDHPLNRYYEKKLS